MNSLPLQGNSLCSNFKFNQGGMMALQHASFSVEGRWYKVKQHKKTEAKQFIAKRVPSPEGIAPPLSPFQLLPPAPSAAMALQLDSQEGNSRAQMDVSPKGSDPYELPLCLFHSEIWCIGTGKFCVKDMLFLITCI